MKRKRLFVVVPRDATDEDMFVLTRYFPPDRFQVLQCGAVVFDQGELMGGVVYLPGWESGFERDAHVWVAKCLVPLMVPPEKRVIVSL